MADRYIDVSATYNGDGTTSAQAASNGGVGAWNSLVDVWDGTPTYGTLSAGDVVYIRTKASGTDLSQTYTAGNLTTKAGSAGSTIKYVFDDGSVWSGDSGTFTLTLGTTTTGRNLTFGNYTELVGKSKNFKLVSAYTGASINAVLSFGNFCTVIGIEVESSHTNGSGVYVTGAGSTLFVDCLFDIGCAYTTSYPIMSAVSGTKQTFVGCEWDLTGLANPSSLAMFGYHAGTTEHVVIGGCVTGSSENSYLIRELGGANGTIVRLRTVNFDFGLLNTEPSIVTIPSIGEGFFAEYTDIPTGNHDFVQVTVFGRSEWRAGANYPVANALLPDAASTPWSYKVQASRAQKGYVYTMPTLSKRYEAAAASKTLTANLLINNRWASPTRDRIWLDVTYVDNTSGKTVTETTRLLASTALTSASGVWTPTVYGSENYTEYKLELTTAGSIKQNTTMTFTISTDRGASHSNDFFFVDPEIVVS